MITPTNQLGEYLRARRELVSPEQAGILSGGTRRVPGLRREEVAMLAGISADYYLRLEQGRDRNPSRSVLDALARVLRLDDTAAEYLATVAVAKPPRHRRARRETVPTGIAQLLLALGLPAFVEGRYFDVLAANALATALCPRLAPGHNRLRDVFLDPAEQALYPDWDRTTLELVAGFRDSVGTDTDDARFVELVGELSLTSPRFRQVWARHDVRAREGASITLAHPQLGELSLHREKLAIGPSGLLLVIYHPDPASAAADKLALLGSFVATPPLSPTTA